MGQPITIKEFLKLSDNEKAERYADMSSHDKFLWRTQSEPIQARVVGHFEMTEKEKQKAEEDLNRILKEIGVLKS